MAYRKNITPNPDSDYNSDRVRRARSALCSAYDPYQEGKDALVDLLADLRHYCDSHGWDFADADRVAHDHYLIELAEGRKDSAEVTA